MDYINKFIYSINVYSFEITLSYTQGFEENFSAIV